MNEKLVGVCLGSKLLSLSLFIFYALFFDNPVCIFFILASNLNRYLYISVFQFKLNALPRQNLTFREIHRLIPLLIHNV